MTGPSLYRFCTKTVLIILGLLLTQPSYSQEPEHPYMPNEGQWDPLITYRADLLNSHILGTDKGLRIIMEDPQNREQIHAYRHAEIREGELKYHGFDLDFVGADLSQMSFQNPGTALFSYFLGNDSSRWASGLHAYGSVQITEVWPGIDMRWYSSEDKLKYEWTLAPYADPEQIRIEVKDAEKVSRSFEKLYIKTSVGDYVETQPYTYQIVEGEKREIKSRWYVQGNTISYDIMEEYDPSLELIIDPTLIFSTFSGSTSDNWGNSATYDDNGNFYLGSTTNGSNFPVTTGAFQTTFGGGTSVNNFPHDITISKFNSTGTTLLYATFIGGNGDDNPNSLIVDGDQVIVAGNTTSSNYPTTSGCIDGSYGGNIDIIITKLNGTGTGLVGSTYLGGTGRDGVNVNGVLFNYGLSYGLKFNYGDDNRSEVNIDDQGNIYVASTTQSTSGVPITYNSPSTKGQQNSLVIKANPNLSNIIWLGNYGGSSDDAAYVIDFDKDYSHIYVAGGTQSANLNTSTSAYQPNYAGNIDGYIMKIDASNGNLLEGTYLGTQSYDQIYGIQVDDSNYVYVVGQTLGLWPVSAGAYSVPGSAQFIQKLDSNLSSTIFSTVYGDGSHSAINISPVAFLVDQCGAIFVSGWGGIVNQHTSNPNAGFTNNMPVTSNALKSTTDGSDYHFIVLSRNAQSLLYGSYFGQNGGGGEHVDGGTSRFDPQGSIYQGICANCSNAGVTFPTTPGAYSTTNSSPNCNAAGIKIDFEITGTVAEAVANPDTSGCVPFVVNFNNQSLNATSNYWFFDDGTASSTSTNASHTYTAPGVYHPFLAVYNPTICIERDTIQLTIIVSDDSIGGQISLNQFDTCGFSRVTFVQNVASQSTSGLDPADYTYFWDFGNGNTSNLAFPPPEVYNNQGNYTVTLTVTHPDACNSPLVITDNFTYQDSTSLDLNIDMPDTLCIPVTFTPTNNSLNVTSYAWDFGDGTTSTLANPTHDYTSEGIYYVTVIGTNPNTCNLTDTLRDTIVCNLQPTANFTLEPYPNVYNTLLRCKNSSVYAKEYLWTFGDGSTSTDENPTHQYKISGDYNVCLVATNNTCRDTLCKKISVTIEPLIDITTGFTPNGDRTNDNVEVNGYGIENIELMIYNRWGEQVYAYEGEFKQVHWDGHFRNTLQESDVYAYVLKAQFTNGENTEKKGNITLIK